MADLWQYLNSLEFYLLVQKTGLYAIIGFLSAFGLVMLWLKPKVFSLDLGWTAFVISLDIVAIRLLLVGFYGVARANLIGSITWVLLLLAIAYTSIYFVYQKLCESSNPRLLRLKWKCRVRLGERS